MRKLFTAVLTTASLIIGAFTAQALPIAPTPPDPVQGIPTPCAAKHPWPGNHVPIEKIKTQFTKNFGYKLAGPQWTERYRPSIRILWETLDAVNCTPFTKTVQSKAHPGLNAGTITGFAWGDWGLTKAGYISLDFSKFEQALKAHDEGRLVRLVIHEMTHAWGIDSHSNPPYWQEFKALVRKEGHFSKYAGPNIYEIFADISGYYVGRCALNNPYDTGKYPGYYNFVKRRIFAGHEFGPAQGVKPRCELPRKDAATPLPGTPQTSGHSTRTSPSSTAQPSAAQPSTSWMEAISES